MENVNGVALAPEEKALKVWDYAVSKQGRQRTEASLIVTDHRVISKQTSNRGIAMNEFSLNSISGISTSYACGSNAIGIFLIVLGVLMACVCVALGMTGDNAMTMVLAGVVIAVLFVVIGVLLLGKAQVSITFWLHGFMTEWDAVQSRSTGFRKGRNSHKKVKVKVDKHAAKEMATEIGAILAQYAKY